ncbi:flagellar basal body P-ring formation protein FlgA [Burkholderia plantarii]|uniref:flagellar basal body P-ring formation chaperone FlgA n=1 Tax=Burkholderia plantarii TaxID=41899 RepID=UPI00272D9B53|nr:flagellar basal body P-ring formation chaperone FlgA [Burkholderia plantarii]WLE57443.1 flagellar basal body P-ring formation protein FlgA [Burkholderia plantarii]
MTTTDASAAAGAARGFGARAGAARALPALRSRLALLALGLAALLPNLAAAQAAGGDGMIVIPGRGESAETALANATAHGVNTPAHAPTSSLSSYSAAELRNAYGAGSGSRGAAPEAAPAPAPAGTIGIVQGAGGDSALRAAAMGEAPAALPEPPIYPTPGSAPSRPAVNRAAPRADHAGAGATTGSEAAGYAAGYAAGVAAARRAAAAQPAQPAQPAPAPRYPSTVQRGPAGTPATAGGTVRAVYSPGATEHAPAGQDAAGSAMRYAAPAVMRVSARQSAPAPSAVAAVVAPNPAPAAAAAPAAAPAQNAGTAQPDAQVVGQPTGQQDPEAIRAAALAFLHQQTAGLPGKATITVAAAFPRGLAACTTLEPFLPTGARLWGRTTVGVRCAGARPWTIYLQSKIEVHGSYYVAAHALAPGDVLTAADLVARDGDLTMLPLAVITDPAQAVGGTSLVRVAAGLPLRQDMLRSASSVTIGQTVRVVAAGQGFSISSEGSVMNNAGPGQQVRVRLAAGQIVTAVVKDGNTVEVPL